jgi:hypothetical protein
MREFYIQDLMDLDNPEEFRFAIELLHESYVGPANPAIEFLYHQEFGGLNKCSRAYVIEAAEKQIDSFMKYLEGGSEDVDVVEVTYPYGSPLVRLGAIRENVKC